MSLEKVSVSFAAVEIEDPEVRRMDADGSTAESQALARAIRKANVNGGYLEDRSPEALVMEAEGPGSIVERDVIGRAARAVKGLPVEWTVERSDASGVGKGVLGGAISRAKRNARDLAGQHGPRVPGPGRNGTA